MYNDERLRYEPALAVLISFSQLAAGATMKVIQKLCQEVKLARTETI